MPKREVWGDSVEIGRWTHGETIVAELGPLKLAQVQRRLSQPQRDICLRVRTRAATTLIQCQRSRLSVERPHRMLRRLAQFKPIPHSLHF